MLGSEVEVLEVPGFWGLGPSGLRVLARVYRAQRFEGLRCQVQGLRVLQKFDSRGYQGFSPSSG